MYCHLLLCRGVSIPFFALFQVLCIGGISTGGCAGLDQVFLVPAQDWRKEGRLVASQD